LSGSINKTLPVSNCNRQRFYGTSSPILESIEPAHSNNINFILIKSDAIPSIEMAINGIGEGELILDGGCILDGGRILEGIHTGDIIGISLALL
jgi:hypothetical protein